MSTEVKAQNSMALASVKAIYDAADEANTLLDGMQTAAEEAGTTLNGIYQDAEDAKTSADNAKRSADTAFSQLSIVENIVGVLDLISKNGDYRLTQDPEIVPDKWYFSRTGTGTTADPYVYTVANVTTTYALTLDVEIDPNKTYYTRSGTAPDYVYTPVANPVVADIGTYYEAFKNPSADGLYELIGIDQSIQNYVSSHLVLTGNTLSLKTDGSDYRLDLTSDGMKVIGADGNPLATYGTSTVIGDSTKFHVQIDGTELGFYDGNVKVAYVRNNQLFIERSVVVEQMDVGYPVGQVNPSTGEIGKGQWSWKVHEVNGQNNLYLKWLG